MPTILDGKELAEDIKGRISERLDSIDETVGMATVLVGDDPASKKYVELKDEDCTEVGIDFETHHLSSDVSQDEVLDLIEELNENDRFDGMIVQLPVPSQIDEYRMLEAIDPEKDVDGLHPYNIGKLWAGDYDFESDLLPCTPKGIMRLLDRYEIDLEGKEAVIINRSDLVGKPLAKLMLDRNATVTICHSRTEDISEKTASADVLVTAVGVRPRFVVTADMVAEGSVIVDVGMNYLEDGVYGDVEFEEVEEKTSYITPVPGGVGPMTRVILLENVLIAGGVKDWNL